MIKNRLNLVDETVKRLLDIITIEKAFISGERLPNEVKLSASLNVSRSTLREAISQLKNMGILESKKGSGTYVVDLNANLTTAVLDEKIAYKLKDVIELRLSLEPHAAMLAVQRADDSEIQAILEQGDRVCERIANSENRIKDEQTFHTLILQATKNAIFIEQLPAICQSIADIIDMKRAIGKLATDTEMDIQYILEAFRARDFIAARHAMEIHVHHLVEALELNKGKYKLY